jgi:hypothetical protein
VLAVAKSIVDVEHTELPLEYHRFNVETNHGYIALPNTHQHYPDTILGLASGTNAESIDTNLVLIGLLL